MFHKILVPLDGSPLAERAIPHAVHFAQVFNAQLIFLQVLDPFSHPDAPHAIEPLGWQIRKSEAEIYLKNIAAHLGEHGLQTDFALREGKSAEYIIEFAHTNNVDLVVLTTHGASGLSRWGTSSIVHKVISKVDLPVLLIRSYQSTDFEEDGSGGKDAPHEIKEVNYRRILLPIDTSRRAECALPAAISLAQGGAQIIFAAVIQPPVLPVPAPYPEEVTTLLDRFMRISYDAVNIYLEEQTTRLSIPVKTRVVESGSISASIHELASSEDVDLVILSAHGQTGGTYWPYGSVVRNYIEHGERTLLVIQDVPHSQLHQTAAEIAAERYGHR